MPWLPAPARVMGSEPGIEAHQVQFKIRSQMEPAESVTRDQPAIRKSGQARYSGIKFKAGEFGPGNSPITGELAQAPQRGNSLKPGLLRRCGGVPQPDRSVASTGNRRVGVPRRGVGGEGGALRGGRP